MRFVVGNSFCNQQAEYDIGDEDCLRDAEELFDGDRLRCTLVKTEI